MLMKNREAMRRRLIMKQLLEIKKYGKLDEQNLWQFIQMMMIPEKAGGIPDSEKVRLFGTDDYRFLLLTSGYDRIKKNMLKYYAEHSEDMIATREFIKKYDFIYDVDGKEFHYDVVSRNAIMGTDLPDVENAVAIIPVFEDGDLLMIKEFRYPLNDYVWAFPAGLIDPGEDACTAAVRELMEETGVKVEKIISVFPGGYSSEGMSDEKLGTVVCRVSGTLKGCEGAEEIHPVKVTVEEAIKIASNPSNKISNKVQIFLAGLLMSQS